MKKTIAIGDVHGRTNWKDIVAQHPKDRIVFLGDYCDPYEDVSNFHVLDNLLDIIKLKKEREDDVVLLLGNHDMHYLDPSFPQGTRYNDGIAPMITSLLEESRDSFQFAYQEDMTLFTHAGLSQNWWLFDFKGTEGDEGRSIADQLNHPTPEQLKAMYQVGLSRGGSSLRGGIFWADARETSRDPLQDVHQVVGHTQMDSILIVSPSESTSITFCDCLRYGDYYQKDGC